MASVKEIEQALYRKAPAEGKCSWDNIGLLVGDPEAEVKKVLVALDITEAVVEEAAALGAELIVSHHPVMNCKWHPVQTVRSDDRQGRILTKLLKKDIAAICMHTNLDAAQGGVNDVLAQILGLTEIEDLNEEKIGRIGHLNCAIPLDEFLPSVVNLLSSVGLRYRDNSRPVYRVAVGGGACGDYLPQAIAAGCDTFVTADLSYHEFLDCTQLNLIDAGHFPTEDVICPVLAQWLQQDFPQLKIVKSASHKEVMQYYMKEN